MKTTCMCQLEQNVQIILSIISTLREDVEPILKVLKSTYIFQIEIIEDFR